MLNGIRNSLLFINIYLGVGEEGPRLIWDQDITASSSGASETTKFEIF